jgi:hypothetical protein
LPAEALKEIIDFIDFLKFKLSDKAIKDNINYDLSELDKKEISHLEEEFRDYKELYPNAE